jgi:hypothetical protein
MPQIQFDATKLSYTSFKIVGVHPGNEWPPITTSILELPVGKHVLIFSSGDVEGAGGFAFEVKSDGTIDYDAKFGNFVSGKGTKKLTVNGFEVTIDARYLLGKGVIVNVNSTNQEFISFKKLRLMPSPAIKPSQGSSLNSSFTYGLDLNGKFTYKPEYDVSKGGFLEGQGTSTLTFYGYPVLIDLRAANKKLLVLADVWYNYGNDMFDGILLVNLLPTPKIVPLIDSAVAAKAYFGLDVTGKFIVDPAVQSSWTIDTFKGIPRLKATRLFQ